MPSCATCSAPSHRRRVVGCPDENLGTVGSARGRVERFKGSLVAEIESAEKLEPGSFDPAEFLPAEIEVYEGAAHGWCPPLSGG